MEHDFGLELREDFVDSICIANVGEDQLLGCQIRLPVDAQLHAVQSRLVAIEQEQL